MVSELQDSPMASDASSLLHQPTSSNSQNPHIILPSVLPSVSARLDRSNYIFWRSQILPTARAYGLDDFLFGTRSPPEQFINSSSVPEHSSSVPEQLTVNPEFLQWTRLDQFLLSWLLSSISENMLGHVLHCITSSEVWKTLDLLFSTKSKARLLHVQFLLQTTKKGTMSIEDYVLKMKSFAHELMSAGQLIPDDELVLYILGGLGPEYESVTVNLTSKDSVTLVEAQYMLQAHELRLENFNASSVMEVSHAAANLTLNNNVSGSVRPTNYQSYSSRGTPFSNPRGLGARGQSNYGGRGFQGSSSSYCVGFVDEMVTLLLNVTTDLILAMLELELSLIMALPLLLWRQFSTLRRTLLPQVLYMMMLGTLIGAQLITPLQSQNLFNPNLSITDPASF